jgi:hypothetical protein
MRWIAVAALLLMATAGCSSSSTSTQKMTVKPAKARLAAVSTTAAPKLPTCDAALAAFTDATTAARASGQSFPVYTTLMRTTGLTSLRACGPANGGNGTNDWTTAAINSSTADAFYAGTPDAFRADHEELDVAADVCHAVDPVHTTNICQDTVLQGLDDH